MSTNPKRYNVQSKKLWRCNVCNDLHYGDRPPVYCPTCGAKVSFIVIDRNEALKIIGDRGGSLTSIKDLLNVWEDFGNANPGFNLVNDKELVTGLAEGVLENQKTYGLKYCPCRVTTDDAVSDLNLICPCDFLIQQTYVERGECWCGLYSRRDKK